MIIARVKREENIAEYILYMWQIEEIIRALGFDKEKIRDYVLHGYEIPVDQQADVYEWYANLSDQMILEGIQKVGHLSQLINLIQELERLSQQLLKMPSQSLYSSVYFQTLPSIIQLRELSGGEMLGEVSTCFIGIFGYLALKAKGSEISEETETSIKQFSTLLAMLADRFREVEEGRLIITKQDKEDDE